MKKHFLVSVIIMLVVFTAGCGNKIVEKKLEKDLEKQLGAKVNIAGDNIDIQTEVGSLQAGDKTTLPEDFPKDVHVIEGDLLSAYKDNSMNSFVINIKTSKSINEIKQIYKEKLAEDNWQILLDFSQADSLSVSAQKDNRNLTVAASEEDVGMTVTIIVGNKMF